MSLPEEDAADLMGRMSPKQVELVCIEIAQIDKLGGVEQESAILSFAEQNPNQLSETGGGIGLAKSLVTKALGKGASETLDNVRQTVESIPFGFLRKVDSQNILTFISEEHPQTIALILSHLPSGYGAEIIAGLPADRQLSVIRRIANMGQTNPEVIEEVEAGLEARMSSVMSQSFENAGGVPTVAEILNVTDRGTERTLLENLAQEDPDLVEEIRRLMFVFDDVQKLNDKDIQSVLKNVEASQWALSLKGGSQDFIDRITSNMSKRAGEMLMEEMDFLGAVKVSDVESMQQQIVDIIRRLEDAGEITLTAGDEEEQLIQ
ncbi:MAG: flagellar motor switch protein FliG [Blastopirellula sp.]|nr:MAG: flagellar motor switch protein FliG [Blastopirellula sp.]